MALDRIVEEIAALPRLIGVLDVRCQKLPNEIEFRFLAGRHKGVR